MKSLRLWIYNLIVRNLPETQCFWLKATMMRWCGAKIGKNVRIGSSVRFSGIGDVKIGNDVWIGDSVYIQANAGAMIAIGSCCDIGPQAMLISGTHEIDTEGAHIAGKGVSKNIVIGNGCWLGARSMILGGVEIPERTVVAAGAVVTKTIENGMSLVAGVPASVRKEY